MSLWQSSDYAASEADFDQVLQLLSVSAEQRAKALFAVPELMIANRSQAAAVHALHRAFAGADSESEFYGGTPHDLLAMLLWLGPGDWHTYVADIGAVYIEFGAASELGQGVTRSIETLAQDEFSSSQLDGWNAAWQTAGKDCEDLQIPLRCLDAAVAVMKSNPKTDRALFRLPLELRRIVRPLLNHALGEATD